MRACGSVPEKFALRYFFAFFAVKIFPQRKTITEKGCELSDREQFSSQIRY
jgi:hypothetical protein